MSISQGWFEPRGCSFPLNSVFEESLQDWDCNYPRKEWEGKVQVSPWPGSIGEDYFHLCATFQNNKAPIFVFGKKKIRSRVWRNRKNQSISMLMNNSNKNVLHSVACQSLHISKHIISLDEKRKKYFSFLNKFPIVITHNYMKFLPRNATQKLWCI